MYSDSGLLRGKFYAETPFKYTAGSTSGGPITPYKPPTMSLDINTNTLEIDANY
jgi:hypothetical protein